MSKNVVVARLTATRADDTKLIVEVEQNASFHSFFKFYSQIGMKRSTKKFLRTANRNEGLHPWHRAYRMEPGLDAISRQLAAFSDAPYVFASIKIRVIKKRAYRRLLTAAPDVLGLTKTTHLSDPRLAPQPATGIPVRIPEGYTTIKKRFEILSGRG